MSCSMNDGSRLRTAPLPLSSTSERRTLSQLIKHSLRDTLDRLGGVAAPPKLDGEERRALEHLELLMFVAIPARNVPKAGETFLSFLRAERPVYRRLVWRQTPKVQGDLVKSGP